MLVTKWKIYKRKRITKIAAFILLLICVTIGVSSGLNIYLNVENYESISEKNYLDSNTLSNELRYAANRLEHVLSVYKSEDYILEGGTVEDLEIEDSWQLTNLYNNYITEMGYENNQQSRELFWKERSKEIDQLKEIILNSDLKTYHQILDNLNNPKGMIYYATDGKNVITNTERPDKNYYKQFNVYIVIDNKSIEIVPNNGYGEFSPSLTDTFEKLEKQRDKTSIYASLTDDGLLLRVNRWNSDRQILIKNTAVIALCLCIILTCFAYLSSVAGRTVNNEEVNLYKIDELPTDLNLILIAGITAFGYLNFNSLLDLRFVNINLLRFAMISSAVIFVLIVLSLFFSIVRQIKKKTFIKHSLLYLLFKALISGILKIAASGPLMLKSIGAILLLIGISAYSLNNPPLLVIIALTSVYLVYIKVKKFEIIQAGLQVAKNGDYDKKITVEGTGEFSQLAENINEMTSGLKTAVQNEVKSEKLKTELITNVSHDIKTPLTSIMSYIDLLKREGLCSEDAPKYLEVLDRKSKRLKTLTEDLFEAAKATSGSIEPKFVKVNVNALVSQILGELDEKINESELTFKVTATEEKVYAWADGRLLSRVMENLLSNIFKYAIKGSRVYINITGTEKEAKVSFKNVSAYELNIPAEELMERFKRGDESRSSEGSGLGLAIAKSLMEIQEGILEISIDADLFTAEVILKKWEPA
ncbi:HAMP domain-containing sensor histidine kinase [Sedimentibacter sp.]|uniref:HAMP domain-containing sensor histidine kinase n=1 Tax=Sedimentibacter sp. TaxID=1960295 RepID=UPI0028ACEDF0|nr:HAMP domain-containing sensor histidine kinase [Sedimentibacter sp.]